MKHTAEEILKKYLVAYYEVVNNPDYTGNPYINAMEEYHSQFQNEKGFSEEEIEKILRLKEPYALAHILQQLVNATDYLLHVKNYDGEKYEEMGICSNFAKEIIKHIEI